MELLENIYRNLIISESVGEDEVNDAIDGHKRVIINYHSKGEDKNTGARVVEVYAYGLTKAGNPVIRCFQPYGDTTSRVPSWKFFRLDRISAWQPTEQSFNRPADFYYKNLGEFNHNGDETMSVVYKVARFGESDVPSQGFKSDVPKTNDDVYKTDTEIGMERLRQDVEHPIYLSDIKVGDAFKTLPSKPVKSSEPKTNDDVYKTDTEVGMERLRKQLENPEKIDVSKFSTSARASEKGEDEKKAELDKLRSVLKDKQQMTLSDLGRKMRDGKTNDDVYKTDTEKGMERLRKQLENPEKIDLSSVPSR